LKNSERLVVTLRLPPRILSPNARPNRHARDRAVHEYRQAAYLLALTTIGRREPPRWPKARTTATFFFPNRRRRDGDNLLASLKPAFDGLADAGIVTNDAGLRHMPVEQRLDRANPRVEIAVEPMGDPAGENHA
jgi:Holliday junction resolvase RusA-like endonuclease